MQIEKGSDKKDKIVNKENSGKDKSVN